MSTLKYANRAKSIENAVVRNEDMNERMIKGLMSPKDILIHVCVYGHNKTYSCRYAHTHTYMFIYTHTVIHIYVLKIKLAVAHALAHTYTYAYKYSVIQIYTNCNTHTHTHTHTHTDLQLEVERLRSQLVANHGDGSDHMTGIIL